MTRTERQKLAISKWIKNKGIGTIIAPTGVGKTRIALMSILAIHKKYPFIRVMIVVPTITLKNQWQEQIDNNELTFNCEVVVINTAIKHNYSCDFLVLDEAHRYSSDLYREVLTKVKYKFILGLTATFERLDGKEVVMKQYCPVVDEITKMEAIANGWVSEYTEYEVVIDVDDIDIYKSLNKEFQQHFEFFQFNFQLAMSTLGKDGWKNKLELCKSMYVGNDAEKRKQLLQQINYHSAGLMRTLQKRKAFINNHPKKIEIAKQIIESRSDAKIITFSNNVKMAESIENGNYVYTGKTSKKKGRVMIEDFTSGKIKHLHSVQRLNEGLDVPDISVAIILGTDSSEIKAIQRKGRAIRLFNDKKAEIFYIIIRDTVELSWFANSHKNDKNYVVIDEHGLNQVLNGQQPDLYKTKITDYKFRF